MLSAYAFDAVKLQAFIDMVDDLMLGESGLSKLEREMIAVAVSAVNHCHYCLTAHGAAVRQRSGDPELGELIAQNYRAADLPSRQKAMLDFAVKLTEHPDKMEDGDRKALRNAGFSDRDIWDIAAVAGFFNMSNRVGGRYRHASQPGLPPYGAPGQRARPLSSGALGRRYVCPFLCHAHMQCLKNGTGARMLLRNQPRLRHHRCAIPLQ